jgi:hypothetical protein
LWIAMLRVFKLSFYRYISIIVCWTDQRYICTGSNISVQGGLQSG